MPVDREAALKQAEKLLRQGKLDGAIEEYVRLVEDQPRDWNSINMLGDLYARAGRAEQAVEQFTKIADHLYTEGFTSKAVALYKKALKTKSDSEPVLAKLALIAGRQGLIADARLFYRQLAEQRRVRGDARGAAECLIALGTLDDADTESRMTAARAAQQIGEIAKAAEILKDTARILEKDGRRAEALEVLVDAAQLDPLDTALRARLARECVRAGQVDRARLFLTLDTADDDPELLLMLAQSEMTAGHDMQGRLALTRLLMLSPSHQGAVMDLARALAADGNLERAHGCVDVITDAAILSAEWDTAIEALQWYIGVLPDIPSLTKLVEVCVDAGRDDILRDAQGRLVEAYRAAGREEEARLVAADLAARDAPVTPPLVAPALPAAPVATTDTAEETIVLEAMEIDLSTALADIDALSASMPPPPTPSPSLPTPSPRTDAAPEGPPRDLESVFEDIRSRVSRDQQVDEAEAQLERGVRLLDEGRADEALADLQAAARVPLFRFKAGGALGRLHIGRGELEEGIEWLERAAEAPAPTPDEGAALLYELADVLELLGESARALAVLMELEADAPGYRDVRSRIDRLTRVQAGSHGA